MRENNRKKLVFQLPKNILNEKGLTLIELLASIVILSIVIITFLAFFTDAFRFNSINSDAIQGMNIAREQQALIKKEANMTQIAEIADKQTENTYVIDKYKGDYHIEINIDKNPEFSNTYKNLHLIHVKVYRGNKLLSETYTYYEGDVKAP